MRKGPGRKSKLTPDLVNRARELAEQGALDKEIAAALGIRPETVCAYKNQFPQFSKAIALGRDFANQCVVGALFDTALKGSVPAQALWLNNKMPEVFARKPEDVATKVAAITFQMVVINADGTKKAMEWPGAQILQAQQSAPPKPKS